MFGTVFLSQRSTKYVRHIVTDVKCIMKYKLLFTLIRGCFDKEYFFLKSPWPVHLLYLFIIRNKWGLLNKEQYSQMSIPNIRCQIRMFGMTATKRLEVEQACLNFNVKHSLNPTHTCWRIHISDYEKIFGETFFSHFLDIIKKYITDK
jgi:hypothetical protein